MSSKYSVRWPGELQRPGGHLPENTSLIRRSIRFRSRSEISSGSYPCRGGACRLEHTSRIELRWFFSDIADRLTGARRGCHRRRAYRDYKQSGYRRAEKMPVTVALL